jgi:hypothetical protein
VQGIAPAGERRGEGGPCARAPGQRIAQLATASAATCLLPPTSSQSLSWAFLFFPLSSLSPADLAAVPGGGGGGRGEKRRGEAGLKKEKKHGGGGGEGGQF